MKGVSKDKSISHKTIITQDTKARTDLSNIVKVSM